jgi:hypothetical protein
MQVYHFDRHGLKKIYKRRPVYFDSASVYTTEQGVILNSSVIVRVVMADNQVIDATDSIELKTRALALEQARRYFKTY